MKSSIAIGALLLGMFFIVGWGIIASVQDDVLLQQVEPTAQQQTIDAAVQELFRQTQQAQQTPDATQTVAAAFSAALTATSAVMPTSTAIPLDVDSIEVVSTQAYDLMAGPARTSAYLAPNGEKFAYFAGLEVCIYLIDGTQENCIPLWDRVIEEEVRIDHETMQWSPDSRYLVMTEDFLRMFRDSDIWLMDTEEGTLTNLTDDQYYQFRPGDTDNGFIDLAPHWIPNEPASLMFIRYVQEEGEFLPPAFIAMDIEGSILEELPMTSVSTRFSVYDFNISHDGQHIVFNRYEREDNQISLSGVWLLDRTTQEMKQIASITEFIPWTMEFSPDGRYVLTLDSRLGQFGVRPEADSSPTRIIDVETGESLLVDTDRYVVSAGWSPQGAEVVYLVRNQIEPEISGLYITDQFGKTGRLLLQGMFSPTTSTFRQPLTWASNDVVLLSLSPDKGVVAVQLGQK